MPEIRQLPPSVINKIAAGEVIERPASVVKELLENSVDAGATRVDVSIKKGGRDLIRVADNGCGIDAEQLPLAVASHATSKIRDADDLFQVHSFGFRGEALASIAEVSQFILRSRTTESNSGNELEVNGGRASEIAPCGCPVGTCIEVGNLFFNTPVREKFLRTVQTEMGHIAEAFTRIAIANPHIHFTLRHNDNLLHELPIAESFRDRIATFFGDDVADHLIPVESEDADVHLSGYVADPTVSRGNNRMQYLLLNGRYIRDRSLQHALGEAYRGLLLTGRYPVAFLRLDMPAAMVDVNVHPAKLEVRFREAGQLYSQLLGTLRQQFLGTDLTARVQSTPESTESAPLGTFDSRGSEEHRRQVTEWAKGAASQGTTSQGTASQGTASQGMVIAEAIGSERQSSLHLRDDQPRQPAWEQRQQSGALAYDFGDDPFDRTPRTQAAANAETTQSTEPSQPGWATPTENGARDLESRPSPTAAHGAIQVQNRYVITEDETGVVIIDQHALHERILYEELREKVLSQTMETQRLLVPEPVSLTPAEAATAIDQKEVLAELGIEIEPFGGDTVLVSAYPAMLANLSPAEVLRQVVEQLMSEGKQPDRRDVLDSLLHMISCKAAIKAGDRLSPEEIRVLIEHRSLCQDAHHCPHGRPTALIFTRDELDRRFKRT